VTARPTRIHRVAVSAALLIALAGLALFIYSPWHRHSPFSNRLCTLSEFGMTAGVQPSTTAILPPEIGEARASCPPGGTPLVEHLSQETPSRAPPA
jgi:hypothetical protein